MFGHMSPPGVYSELQRMANHTNISGLKIYVTHIKESLVPHPSGRTARYRIMAELRDLERKGGLGVEFIEVKKGDRISKRA
jgi:cAMP phosphodiesterase